MSLVTFECLLNKRLSKRFNLYFLTVRATRWLNIPQAPSAYWAPIPFLHKKSRCRKHAMMQSMTTEECNIRILSSLATHMIS